MERHTGRGYGGETYRGQKVTGGRETYRRNLQGVKRLIGLETYMRNIQEWRDIQGEGGERDRQEYRDSQKVGGGSETYIKRNLQGVGRKNLQWVETKSRQKHLKSERIRGE